MLRWLCAFTAAVVVTGFALLLVTGDYINDGPVVASVSRGHGLHAGDIFVILGWLVAMMSLVVLVMSSGRRPAPWTRTGAVPALRGRRDTAAK